MTEPAPTATRTRHVPGSGSSALIWIGILGWFALLWPGAFDAFSDSIWVSGPIADFFRGIAEAGTP